MDFIILARREPMDTAVFGRAKCVALDLLATHGGGGNRAITLCRLDLSSWISTSCSSD